MEHGESVPRDPVTDPVVRLFCMWGKLREQEEGLMYPPGPSRKLALIRGSLRLRYMENTAMEATESRRRVLYLGTSLYCTGK